VVCGIRVGSRLVVLALLLRRGRKV
jgi:hypothetical protein